MTSDPVWFYTVLIHGSEVPPFLHPCVFFFLLTSSKCDVVLELEALLPSLAFRRVRLASLSVFYFDNLPARVQEDRCIDKDHSWFLGAHFGLSLLHPPLLVLLCALSGCISVVFLACTVDRLKNLTPELTPRCCHPLYAFLWHTNSKKFFAFWFD